MIPKPTIRTYQAADQEDVLHLLRLNTPQYFSAAEEEDFIYYLENEIEHYFVVEWESQIVGCGGFNFSGDMTHGKISWDIIHPDYQGKSIGTMLLQYRIAKLQAYETLDTMSVRTSQLVYPFYEKQGFRLVYVEKDYWAKGFDLYQMVRNKHSS
jgi:ribosomal protein S18 acetylase RimI-like enzyme